jgi:hypothetical protein
MKFGDRVRDEVTGFTGIITAEANYMNGSHQFLVEPAVSPAGAHQAGAWFEARRLIEAPENIVFYGATPPPSATSN